MRKRELEFCKTVHDSVFANMPPVEIVDIDKLEEDERKKLREKLEHDEISSVCSEEMRENLSKLLELNLSSIFEVEEVNSFLNSNLYSKS